MPHQSHPHPPLAHQPPPPKTALVLSAGGMFGAYHAGAYRAIREVLTPDLVVGASVGALNGWPIAAGCTPEQLIARWRDPAIGNALRLLPGGGPFRFDPAGLRDEATRLHRDYTPRIPFGLIVTRLAGLKPCLIQHPHVTRDHLLASGSIPLCLPPVQIGPYRYTDGGLLDKLPIQAAIDMGATRIIAVDCLRVTEWWARAGFAFWRLFKRKLHLPPAVELTLIAPERPLGTLSQAVFWTPENAERWIALGELDARRILRSGADALVRG